MLNFNPKPKEPLPPLPFELGERGKKFENVNNDLAPEVDVLIKAVFEHAWSLADWELRHVVLKGKPMIITDRELRFKYDVTKILLEYLLNEKQDGQEQQIY
jgi:hypothetical protein